jgi:two-component system, OmpR family, sensor histidine kinase KdpD
MRDQDRPDPEALLQAVKQSEMRGGKLRVFFGMSAGVGKTYAMLKAGHDRLREGWDVTVGYVEHHNRSETSALVEGLPIVPRKQISYKGIQVEEMDLEAILKLKPKLVLVDELAHTNAPGSRHAKRYQDVFELLDHGIDVFTTVNVQHLESRKEAVEQISKVLIRETVPDSVLERANQIQLVDITPQELLKRMREGKVYLGERAEAAQANFFKEGPLTALREIALRLIAEKVDRDLQGYMIAKESPWKTTERLMVAISHSPYSETLIRATRRKASMLESTWLAVNIDTGAKLNEEDQAQLMKNINLVAELGGELLTITETDIPLALERIARQKNVTQIVLGRPTKRFFKDFFGGGSLLDRLVSESGEFDVHVIRTEHRRPHRARRWVRPNFNSRLGDYFAVGWIMVAVSIVSAGLLPVLGYKAVGSLFVLAVLGVSLVFGMGPIFFAALSSALIWDYFFIPPRMTFLISQNDDLVMCASYFVTALITGTLTSRIRRHETLLRDREARSTLLYEIVSDMVREGNGYQFITTVSQRIERLFGGECAVFLKNQSDSVDVFEPEQHPFAANPKENAVATWSIRSNKRAGWGTDTLSDAAALYIPLQVSGEPVGALAYKPDSRKALGVDRENLLSILAKQIAIAVEREKFQEKSWEAKKLRESERLHQTLLDSVSHELRTPLTALIGAASAAADQLSGTRGNALGREIAIASERLNRVIENLLDMTRLNSGALTLKKEWQDVHDLVGVAIRKLGLEDHLGRIQIQIDEGVSLVEIDFRLIEHVLSNLVFNAVTYSSGPVTIRAWLEQNQFYLAVEDEGPGLPEEALPKIFDKFFRAPGTPAGGTGLGLTIAKNIVELHGGRISAQNRKPHGLCVKIELPLGVPPEVTI